MGYLPTWSARRLTRVLTQPFMVTQAFTGHTGRTVDIDDTLAGCRAILGGEGDDMPEAAFYLVGTLEDARAKHATMRETAKNRPEESPA